MQIENKKLIKKSVTDPSTGKVYSGLDFADCVPFVLDADKIEMRTLDKRSIKLPYSGPLPLEFEGAEDTYIFLAVNPVHVSVMLGGTRDGKKLSASIEATHKEINDVLFRFFYKEGKGHNTYVTRFDNNLEGYWMGHLQAEYNLWHRIMLEGGATSVAMNLPDDKRAGLLKFLQLMEREQAESATV